MHHLTATARLASSRTLARRVPRCAVYTNQARFASGAAAPGEESSMETKQLNAKVRTILVLFWAYTDDEL